MDVLTLLMGAALLAGGLVLGMAIGRGRRSASIDAAVGTAATRAAVADLLEPASDALLRVETRLREVERERVGAYAGLREQVSALHRSSAELGTQTRALAGALRAPTVRGRWGELQLQRIVELAGMLEHCDFDSQVHTATRDGRVVRPDLVVRLSGGRSIPVDAKVPFAAWLEAQEPADDARRRQLVLAHARALRGHVDALASKAYWEHFQPAPEFVVMFVPGEPLLDAAMTADPSLTEYAFARNVVIATPATLIALLRTIAFTWRQERLSHSAEEIHALGRDLYGRLATLSRHLSTVGTSLNRAVDAYNASIRTFDSRVLSSARRFVDLGVAESAVPAPSLLDAHAGPDIGSGAVPYDVTDPGPPAEVAPSDVGQEHSVAPRSWGPESNRSATVRR